MYSKRRAVRKRCPSTHLRPPIDLVLTDLFLPPPEFQLHSDHNRYPRVNGDDPVRQPLSLKKEARVLFMSSHTLGNLSSQGINIIPERFLHKPFTAQQLLEHVAAALAAPPIHRSTSPAIRPTNGIRGLTRRPPSFRRIPLFSC